MDRAAFFVEHPVAIGAQVTLSAADAQHIAVLRLSVGERVGLRDGVGGTSSGTLVRLSRKNALVEVDQAATVPPPAPIHLLVPVADRDRMLWLAEKAAELNVTTWRPVLWHRSRSVSPRGDGPEFRNKVRSRMIAAVLQSRSAWLPEIFPEATIERAIAAAPEGGRIVLDAHGANFRTVRLGAQIVIAVGPEGGFEDSELEAMAAAGFTSVSIGKSILRFETAAIAGVATALSMRPA